jgi:Mrp family chromosome partitioning ATPase
VQLRVVGAAVLLGLAAAAVVLAVVPPRPEVRQVHHAAAGVDPARLAAAPGLDADTSALLGGRPDPAGVADAVDLTPGAGTLEVRSRAETPDDAAVVAEAVGTVLARRAATGPDAAGAALVADPVEDLGTRPPPAAVLAGGAVVGLAAGLLAGGLRARGVASTESLARHADRPVLARVPARGLPRDPAVLARVPEHARGRDPVRRRATAVRDLAGQVRDAARAARVVVVLALEPQATAVSVAADLAVALAADGERVLLVEGGPGSASSPVQRIADPTPGVREVLAGSAELGRTVQRWARGGLDVLPAGTPGHRGAPPLAGDDVAAVLARLREGYDRIVVDAPGEPGAPAAVELARAGDVTVLVVPRGAPPGAVTTTLAALDAARVEVRGTVLTGGRGARGSGLRRSS